uniref:Syntaxin-2 n=1 Tax=Caligus clemensi TaxID=344056 RepID=C1C392_CALCM|nr:Syntaxin-2 [Caligus clemensi]
MVKNRLAELQSRAKYPPVGEKEEMIALKEKAKDKVPTYDEMCDSFSDISTDIDKLKSLVQDINKIQGTLLNSARKDDNLESSMNTKMNEAKKLGTSIRTSLEQHKAVMSEEAENPETMMSRMRKTLFRAQSKRFYDIWNSYNTQQVEFRDKNKTLLVRRCKIVNSGYDDEAIETMLDEGKTGVFATAILDQEKLARRQLIELQDRHDEFIKLEASIREVRDMFMDIANLISTQGETIDNIYTQVMSAETNVEAGKKHLSSAEDYAKKARRKKFCLFTVGIVIFLIIMLILLFEVGAFSWGSEASSTHTKEIIYIYVNQTTTTSTEAPTISSSTTTIDLIHTTESLDPLPLNATESLDPLPLNATESLDSLPLNVTETEP